MTYNDVFLRRNLLANIPLVKNGVKLPKSTAATLMLLRVSYQQKVDEFVKILEEVQKEFKKDGYDERASKIAEMRSIDERKKAAESWKESDGAEKPEMPSKEELDKAEEIRKTLADFEKEQNELNEHVSEAQDKHAKDNVQMSDCTFTKSEFADIYEIIGADGEMEYSIPNQSEKSKVPCEWFLNMIAYNLVG